MRGATKRVDPGAVLDLSCKFENTCFNVSVDVEDLDDWNLFFTGHDVTIDQMPNPNGNDLLIIRNGIFVADFFSMTYECPFDEIKPLLDQLYPDFKLCYDALNGCVKDTDDYGGTIYIHEATNVRVSREITNQIKQIITESFLKCLVKEYDQVAEKEEVENVLVDLENVHDIDRMPFRYSNVIQFAGRNYRGSSRWAWTLLYSKWDDETSTRLLRRKLCEWSKRIEKQHFIVVSKDTSFISVQEIVEGYGHRLSYFPNVAELSKYCDQTPNTN